MNLGDGLLFELENGKPRLILLSHGGEKNPVKLLSLRPRAAALSSRRPPCAKEEVHGEERPPRQPAGRHKEARSKAGGAATSSVTEGRSTTLTLSKTHDHHKGGAVKMVAKLKSDRHKHSTAVRPVRANGKTGMVQNTAGGGKAGLKDTLTNEDNGQKESVVCLTSQQLQQILNAVQHPAEDHRAQDPSGPKSISGNEGGEMKQGDRGGEGMKQGGNDPNGSSEDKDSRSSGCLFSWLEERQSDSRAAVEAKKAQLKRDLDEQLLKQQQRSAPGRLQAEQDAESVLSVRSSDSHREQAAAVRSSLRLGEVTPMEEVLSLERREEQRRRWLEELDRQREETSERRRQEKLLQNQTEDHQLWAAHFDSLQRRPPVQAPSAPSAPPPAQLSSSERGEWEPTSSLSLWEAASSCGAESAGRASVDTSSACPTRTSYLRTMTSLLDPAQLEERERRRLKQLEQQRAIEAQVEERRRKREQEEAKRRQEEEEEERRVALEREMLQRQYQRDTLREKQKEQVDHPEEPPNKSQGDSRLQETPEPETAGESEGLVDACSSYKDTAVQTDAAPSTPLRADRVLSLDLSAEHQPPPNSRSRAVRAEKENICLTAGGDPYEPFARTDRSRGDKRRPEWNTQRPSRRFVPASERYPAVLQRNRQESRLKRQAELLALQERTCLPRTEPPAQHQELRLLPNTTKARTSPNRVESGSRARSNSANNTERGRSPPVPAVRHMVQIQPAPTPPPVLEFIPYVRTDEVFNLDPLEPADTPPLHTHSGALPQSSAPAPSHRDPLLHPELLRNAHTHRQEQILRGLAQLRQGLLQKQRELETDLNPLLKRHGNEHHSSTTTHHM
ncbi:coiled-coil domain-containing protein 66 [Parambassis ranga]|uniref:Coiled-coil domain-containing protein 66 n=1 Tax=Parambassis ranga TaxID=210632 RepID=A0A6P7K796_9TELE|nr:coiled-coil domain-containing protein 66 [Parambassis ranga]